MLHFKINNKKDVLLTIPLLKTWSKVNNRVGSYTLARATIGPVIPWQNTLLQLS